MTITHDRYFLDHTAQLILELDGGRACLYRGSYSTYLETKAARLIRYEQRASAAEAPRLLDVDEIPILPGPRLGGQVIEAEGLTKRFGDQVLLE